MKKITLFTIASLLCVLAFGQNSKQVLRNDIHFGKHQTGLKVRVVDRIVSEQAINAPADLVSETYNLTAYDNYFEEYISPREVQVGRYGENEVYIQGLSEFMPQAWVKGTIDANNVVTVPATLLGIMESFYDIEISCQPTTFVYDPDAEKYTAEEFSTVDQDEYPWDMLSNLVLTKITEVAATPADPSVADFVFIAYVEEDGTPVYATYPYVSFSIPVEDVDGNPLSQSKLSYVIYIEDAEGQQHELTLTTDLYTNLTEDITEIPYNFTDKWDILACGLSVYLNQGSDEIMSWKKIGVQSIYRGMGEERRSNIGWFNIQEYLAEFGLNTGISDIEVSNDKSATYFDLQGRVADKSQKGILIMQTRDVKGNLKSTKVLRK